MTPAGEILVSLLAGAGEEGGLPELLCRDAVRRMDVTSAAIALSGKSGAIELTVGSDPRATVLENVQISLGEGPCIQAFASGRTVAYADLAHQERPSWPLYAAAALGLGVRAIFCYPLSVGGIRLGVLDLYRDRPGMLDDVDLALALHYADAAVMVLLHLREAARADGGRLRPSELAATVEVALGAHPEVHQATGMIAIQADVGLTEALLLLRAQAFAEDRSIVEVARDVVDRRVGFA